MGPGRYGALGLKIAKWLAEKGARHLVLVGRRGASAEAKKTVNELTESGVLPETIELQQNYPNPFNASTEICFQLPEAANVTLRITNQLGQTVGTLLQGKHPAGVHTVTWDGGDRASGVYFVILETMDFCQIRKVVLLR